MQRHYLKNAWLSVLIALLCVGVAHAVPPSEPDEVEPWKPDNTPMHLRHSLPSSLIDQGRSYDNQYVAQLMYVKPGPTYYLAIIDNKLGQRYYLDHRLIIGEQYPFQQMRVYWKKHTVYIRARHADNSHYYFILYNIHTGKLTEGKTLIKAARQRKKLNPEDLQTVLLDTLDQRLQLHKQIPIGVTYDALKLAIPQLGQLRADAGKHLTEAILPIDVYGHKTQVEFNFKDRVMYNFNYNVTFRADPGGAEGLYKQLQAYYQQHYGDYLEESLQEEPGYRVQNSVWNTDEAQVGVVNNISYSHNTISWSIKF